MKIINNENIKSISAGEYTSKWYFEIRKDSCGSAVEIKGFGFQLRWYPDSKFFHVWKPEKYEFNLLGYSVLCIPSRKLFIVWNPAGSVIAHT